MAFIGIEREPSYFDIACRRIEEAYKQPRLFAEPVQKPVQDVLI
jgi:DNA modification methylase